MYQIYSKRRLLCWGGRSMIMIMSSSKMRVSLYERAEAVSAPHLRTVQSYCCTDRSTAKGDRPIQRVRAPAQRAFPAPILTPTYYGSNQIMAGPSTVEHSPGVVPSRVEKDPAHGPHAWRLMRGDEPYFIKGAGGHMAYQLLAGASLLSFGQDGASITGT